jgi:hypothetical protein
MQVLPRGIIVVEFTCAIPLHHASLLSTAKGSSVHTVQTKKIGRLKPSVNGSATESCTPQGPYLGHPRGSLPLHLPAHCSEEVSQGLF